VDFGRVSFGGVSPNYLHIRYDMLEKLFQNNAVFFHTGIHIRVLSADRVRANIAKYASYLQQAGMKFTKISTG